MTAQVTKVLLIWKWMIPTLFKNHVLKCWICLTSLNWTEAPASSLMLIHYLRKLELWFILSLFLFLSWSLRYFGCRYEGIIQKKYRRIVFFFFFSLGYGGSCNPIRGSREMPWWGRGPRFLFYFFCTKHAKTVIFRWL